ncbi:MAG: Hpt domain-containing protein [Spirochaetales bacterium]|nr:Hpt domain-containing protein [Spirochaetales bacterium]
MATGIEHRNEFLIDTEKILDRIGLLFTNKIISISQVYREVHSLKGAAGFAGLTHLETIAHRLEEILIGIRDGKITLNEEVEALFYHVHDYFIKDINIWKTSGEELDPSLVIESLESKKLYSKPIAIEVIEDKIANESYFNDFEETLLKEAMYRGELFYRVICHIDNDEEMKYPRLFLVINNLEKLTNVIKVDPPMELLNKNKSKEITLYLTSDKSKSTIYKGLSFDRIKEVEFQRLDFSTFVDRKSVNEKRVENSLYGKKIDIETSKIEEILNYYQDLSNKLINDSYIIEGKKNSVYNLLEGLKKSLGELTTINFFSAFSFLESYSKKLGKELGKEVNFIIKGEDLSIDRQLAEKLKEVFLQLVKNSIDHGIETPYTRLELGKPREGSIILNLSLINEALVITLQDDGKGIDTKNVISKGIEGNFIDENDEMSLLSLISRPGFSTSKDVNYYSGRGIGLDLVVDKVVNSLEGKIRLENNYKKGVVFHILIPPHSTIKKFTLFKYRNATFAISSVNIAEKIVVNNGNIELGDSSTLAYNYNGKSYPIFTPWGRLSSSKAQLQEKYAFIIRYLGTKAIIPVDEFVLEKEYFSSVISLIDCDTPGHKKVKIGEKVENFTLLLPSVINS